LVSLEQDLLQRARRFDAQALGEIYDCYSPAVYRYAVRLLRTPDLAEECVAEVFHRLLQAWRAGGGPQEHLQAYLFRVAHNWITDQWRRQPPPLVGLDEEKSIDEEGDPSRNVIMQAEQEEVRAALAHLTPDQRQVVLLKYLEGLENEEIAAALGKPLGAVKSLQHRALAALRRILVRAEEGTCGPA
jgi:RNA polymerase sigma-70 factor (ECF subfamily)